MSVHLLVNCLKDGYNCCLFVDYSSACRDDLSRGGVRPRSVTFDTYFAKLEFFRKPANFFLEIFSLVFSFVVYTFFRYFLFQSVSSSPASRASSDPSGRENCWYSRKTAIFLNIGLRISRPAHFDYGAARWADGTETCDHIFTCSVICLKILCFLTSSEPKAVRRCLL